MEKFEVRDLRHKEKFQIDDAYLNGQAKICGWQATLVYLSLCRHADKDQEAFPSIQLIGEELKISKNTVLKGLAQLEKHKVIFKANRKRNKKGKWLNNIYALLDKKYWLGSQVPEKDLGSQVPVRDYPSPCEGLTQVPVRDTKDTHMKDTHMKDNRQPSAADSINKILTLFHDSINPTINYAHKGQRQAVEALAKKLGWEKLDKLVNYALSVQGQKYAPTITTPYQLKEKLGDLMVYYKKNNQQREVTKI